MVDKQFRDVERHQRLFLVNSLKLFAVDHSLLKWDKSTGVYTKPVLEDME